MAILDKLMEKKDLENYLRFRIEEIELELKNTRGVPEKLRQDFKEFRQVRIDELQRLLKFLSQGQIKNVCKSKYKKLNKENN